MKYWGPAPRHPLEISFGQRIQESIYWGISRLPALPKGVKEKTPKQHPRPKTHMGGGGAS